ncbi:MAG: hypothetical protein JWR80_8018 [Bradyrhizobium sp.]|nr:hypothetical protein [Bradyrhizobium sp.]
MAWTVRSLAEISGRVRGHFREWLPGTDTGLANNFVTVVAKVLAALGYEYELRQAWLTRQMFIRTATGAWLEQHCSDVGIYRRPASIATGTILGTGFANTTYAAGIRFVSGNQLYRSRFAATSDADGILFLRIKSESKGAATNRDADALLTLADPAMWQGLGTTWTVDEDGLGGGAEKESDDSLRARGLQRKQNPPRGGALSDYERIARAVPGVLKAWAYRRPDAPGFISVLFLFEGRTDNIPITADVEAVQAAIDRQRLIRVDDSVAVAPVALPVNVTVSGLQTDSQSVRDAIEAAIRAMFLAKCRPGITGDTFTLSKSWISEAISGASGEDRHVLTLPAGDIVLTNGQFPTLGAMTYVA